MPSQTGMHAVHTWAPLNVAMAVVGQARSQDRSLEVGHLLESLSNLPAQKVNSGIHQHALHTAPAGHPHGQPTPKQSPSWHPSHPTKL